MDRRDALTILAALLTAGQAQPLAQGSPCRLPEVLTLHLGAGACAVHTIEVHAGVYVARLPVAWGSAARRKRSDALTRSLIERSRSPRARGRSRGSLDG